MNARLWSQVNSPIVVWFFGTVVVGLAALVFDYHTDNRDRSRALQDRLDRLGFEYAGRLSQYSEWFIYLMENPDDLTKPRLRACVTPSTLKTSIRIFAGPPRQQDRYEYSTNIACKSKFSYAPIFNEFREQSTVSILAEMRLIHDEMKARGDGRMSKPLVAGCKFELIPTSERLTIAMNGLINPDAVIPLGLKDLRKSSVEDLRRQYMCAFYGIGPQDLWYTDVFAG
jgi:hypothetical protein